MERWLLPSEKKNACFDVVRGWEEDGPKNHSCEEPDVFR